MAADVHPKRIKWANRDAGQKGSIIVIVAVLAGLTLFSAYSLVTDLLDGRLWAALASATFVAIWTAWLTALARGMGVFDARG